MKVSIVMKLLYVIFIAVLYQTERGTLHFVCIYLRICIVMFP